LRFLLSTQNFDSTIFYHLAERLIATLTIIWLVWSFFDKDQREIPISFYLVITTTLVILAVVSVSVKPRLLQILPLSPLVLDLIWQLIALAMIVIGLMSAFLIRPPMMKILVLILLVLSCGHLLQILLINNMRWHMGAVRFAQIIGLPWLLAFTKHHSFDENPLPENKIHPKTRLSKTPEKIQSFWNSFTSKIGLAKSIIIAWIESLKNRSPKESHPEILPEVETNKGYTNMPNNTKPALVNLLLRVNLAQTLQEKLQAIVHALSFSVVADICFLVNIPEETDKVHIVSGYDLIRELPLKPDILAMEDLPQLITAWNSQKTLALSQDDAQSHDAQTLAMLLNYHTIGNMLAFPLGLPERTLAGGVIFLSPYTGKRWGESTVRLMEQIKDTLAAILFAPDPQEKMQYASNQAQLKIHSLIEAAEKLRTALLEKEAQIQAKETTIKGLKAKYQIDKMESMTRLERMKQKIAELNTQITSQQDFTFKLEQLHNENRQLIGQREQLQMELNRTKTMLKDLQTETGQTGPIRLSLENQIISLDSIAANARLRVASLLQKNNIDLEIHNPDGRLMIKTDPELLQTALFELLTNAILASEYGGTIKLEQKLTLEMGMLTIQVTDFGQGLTPAEQTALFSAQHDTIPGIGNVSSIRNAIRAIRVLNGKIWLKSKKVSFTTFRFQIPVRIID